MNDHRNAIACETNVKLNSIRTRRDRFAKRGHRVFRRDGRRSAMTDD
jgi:hypothetical protein